MGFEGLRIRDRDPGPWGSWDSCPAKMRWRSGHYQALRYRALVVFETDVGSLYCEKIDEKRRAWYWRHQEGKEIKEESK